MARTGRSSLGALAGAALPTWPKLWRSRRFPEWRLSLGVGASHSPEPGGRAGGRQPLSPSGQGTAQHLGEAARVPRACLWGLLQLGLGPLPGQRLLQFGFKKQSVTWRGWGGNGAQVGAPCPGAGAGWGSSALTWAVRGLFERSLLAAAPAQAEHTPGALGTGKLVSECLCRAGPLQTEGEQRPRCPRPQAKPRAALQRAAHLGVPTLVALCVFCWEKSTRGSW